MVELTPINTERSRTYRFPGGETVKLVNVVAIAVRPSGTHRLKTHDGRLHIVPAGWLHIEIEADGFSI